jgi:RNA polymerase sigma-70 factor (ECF subfamily)
MTVDEPLSSASESSPCPGEGLLQAFDAMRDELFRKLYAVLGNYEDAQDTLQVAFLRCWETRARLAAVRNLRGWICRVSLNAACDLRRRLRHRRGSPLSVVEETAACARPSPADALADRERRDRLGAALVHLRPAEKDVFLLRQDGALTYEEIARLRGDAVGTVKTRMHLAVRKLREVLQTEE